MIKYSFIIPYYKRPDHLWNTLFSYRHHYSNRTDYEILIVEDLANDDDIIAECVHQFPTLPIKYIESSVGHGVNPVFARNLAALEAKGIYLINTNPECFHKVDILKGFDTILNPEQPDGWGPGHPQWNTPSWKNKHNKGVDTYVVCSCENVEFKGRAESFAVLEQAKHLLWYDHPTHNSRNLHWCSCLSRRLYMTIGGFDEYYHGLCGYDDDDFKTKIVNANIPIRACADLLVCHIDHERSHQDESLRKKSLEYYQSKWTR